MFKICKLKRLSLMSDQCNNNLSILYFPIVTKFCIYDHFTRAALKCLSLVLFPLTIDISFIIIYFTGVNALMKYLFSLNICL